MGDRSLPAEQQELKVLGAPLGSAAFAQKLGEKRPGDERKFWDQLPKLPDLQSAWLLLLHCAGPRFNYTARTVPPSQAALYAQGHDKGVWEVLAKLFERPDLQEATDTLHNHLATLPLRLGGCGLRSAHRTSKAAYWT